MRQPTAMRRFTSSPDRFPSDGMKLSEPSVAHTLYDAQRLPDRQERHPVAARTSCDSCLAQSVCFHASALQLETDALALPAPLKISRRSVVYRAGDTFDSLYVIRTGSFKIIQVRPDGREHISSFPMLGDVIGMDGFGSGVHTSDAMALEDSQICAIPLARLDRLCAERPETLHAFHRTLGAEIVREQDMLTLLGTACAEERLAHFLLTWAARQSSRGYSPRHFILRMTREDIGNFLGMKLETVSRGLSEFQRLGMIAVRSRDISIVDNDALGRVATA